MRTLLLTLAFIISCSAFADGQGSGKASTNPDAVAVDQACAAEAQTAGCGGEQVGTGMLKCIHAYKQAHKKDFKLSDGCKAAMKKMHQDKQSKAKS